MIRVPQQIPFIVKLPPHERNLTAPGLVKQPDWLFQTLIRRVFQLEGLEFISNDALVFTRTTAGAGTGYQEALFKIESPLKAIIRARIDYMDGTCIFVLMEMGDDNGALRPIPDDVPTPSQPQPERELRAITLR